MNLDAIFRAYDIRGLVPAELTPELAFRIGQSLAEFLDEGIVAVGRDMRPDSEELSSQIIEGLIDRDREVWDLGLVSTDMVYFAIGHYKLAGGAAITASHNPGGYNGIKLCNKGAARIGINNGLNTIKQAVFINQFSSAKNLGKMVKKNILSDWIEHVLSFIDVTKLNLFTIAVDAANGMAGLTVPELIKKVPFRVMPLYFEPDGTFPNHEPNPMIKQNIRELIKTIRTKRLDFGIAFDGDADRTFLVDETGELLPGDIILAMMAEWILKRHPGVAVTYDVRCSRVVKEVIENNGGRAVRTKVGHPFIAQAMHQADAVFGGELSGHYYFKHNFYADSGLIAAMVISQIFSESNATLSTLAKPYRKYYQSGEINIEVADKAKTLDKLSRTYSDGKQDGLDGLTVEYRDWWFNVRPSNTEPFLRLNIEASAKQLLEEKQQQINNLLARQQ